MTGRCAKVDVNSALRELKGMAYACRRCGNCREKYSDDVSTRMESYRVCPIREHTAGFECHYARGKMQIAQGILEGQLAYSEQLIDLLFTDPDCKLCSWVCGAEPVLDPPQVWRAMRKDIVAAGLGPPAKIKAIDDRVHERHNVFGARPDVRARWAKEHQLARKGSILYFAGCYASYQQTEIAGATVAVLRAAGIDVSYLGEDEWCCGAVQFHDGSVSVAEDVARHNVKMIHASGAQTVVTACAECYKSLKHDYADIMGRLPFEVRHISELLAELIDGGRISFKAKLPESRLTFHDPCRLGRYCGIYEPPREVLRKIPGVVLVEMKRHKENAWCCGGGADLVQHLNPDLASAIAMDRLEEAGRTHAEAIVTACPRCIAGFRRSGAQTQTYDLIVAIARAMGLP